MTTKEAPWWAPVLADEAWIARLREDYPDDTEGDSDKEVQEEYNPEEWKYSDVWDHLGDARADWEKLADSWTILKDFVEDLTTAPCTTHPRYDKYCHVCRAKDALKKAMEV